MTVLTTLHQHRLRYDVASACGVSGAGQSDGFARQSSFCLEASWRRHCRSGRWVSFFRTSQQIRCVGGEGALLHERFGAEHRRPAGRLS